MTISYVYAIYNLTLRYFLGYESDKGEAENLDHIGDSSDSWSTISDAIDDAHKIGSK